jgi:hypothetical protein
MSNRRQVEAALVRSLNCTAYSQWPLQLTKIGFRDMSQVSERRCQQFEPASVRLNSPNNNRSRIECGIGALILSF